MNKRTYQKVLKRVLSCPIVNPPHVLTPLEKLVKRVLEDRCYTITQEVIYELEAEDEYYRREWETC